MNIVSSKKKTFLDVTSIEEDALQKKIMSFISISTTVLLVCIVIVMSALVFDLIVKMNNPEKYATVRYMESNIEKEKEPFALRIDL